MRRIVGCGAVAFVSLVGSFAAGQVSISPTIKPPAPRPVPTLTAGPAVTLSDPRLTGSTTSATTSTFTTRLTGVRFEWDFGGGAVPNTLSTTTATAPVVLGHPGTYNVRVTAFSASGAPTEARAAVAVRAFARSTTVSSTSSSLRAHSIVLMPTGESVVVQCVRSSGAIHPQAQIIVERGGAVIATSPVTATKDTCDVPFAAVGADGRLRLLIASASTLTLYTARTPAIPAGTSDWQSVPVATDSAGRSLLTFRADGRPVIAYQAATAPMRVAIASSAVPTEASHFTKIDGPRFNADFGFTLLRDRPVFLFRTDLSTGPPDPNNGVRLAIATSATPSGTGDFPLMTLPRPAAASTYGGYDPSLGVYGGRLVAFYREGGAIRMARATADVPSSPADFAMTNAVERVTNPAAGGIVTSVQSFQERMMLVYDSAAEHRIAMALTRSPAGPGDWESFAAPSAAGFSVASKPSELLVAHLDAAAKLAVSIWR